MDDWRDGDSGLGGVTLTELSPTEWRVAHVAIVEGDPPMLLGFIQRVGDTFEVTNLGRSRERSYYPSFERAAASLSERIVLT